MFPQGPFRQILLERAENGRLRYIPLPVRRPMCLLLTQLNWIKFDDLKVIANSGLLQSYLNSR